MDVSLILRVAGIGILVAVAAQIQATLVTVAGLVVVFLLLVEEIGNLFGTVRSTFGF